MVPRKIALHRVQAPAQTGKPVYRCEFLCWADIGGNSIDRIRNDVPFRARVRMIDDHKFRGGFSGEVCVTTRVFSIDFIAGTFETRNSIYKFGKE